MKSNNFVQNNEQHNAALRRRSHEKTQKKTLDICGNHLLLNEMEEKKRCRWVILGQKMT